MFHIIPTMEKKTVLPLHRQMAAYRYIAGLQEFYEVEITAAVY